MLSTAWQGQTGPGASGSAIGRTGHSRTHRAAAGIRVSATARAHLISLRPELWERRRQAWHALRPSPPSPSSGASVASNLIGEWESSTTLRSGHVSPNVYDMSHHWRLCLFPSSVVSSHCPPSTADTCTNRTLCCLPCLTATLDLGCYVLKSSSCRSTTPRG